MGVHPETDSMKRAAIAALAALGLSAVPQQEKPSMLWAKTWEEAVAEAGVRNVPIYATFHKDG
jgi:hypothetical protein